MAAGGLEGIYSVIAESMFCLILSSNHQRKGAYKLRWLCFLMTNPKERFRFHLGLITVYKYADSPLLMLVPVLVQEGEYG